MGKRGWRGEGERRGDEAQLELEMVNYVLTMGLCICEYACVDENVLMRVRGGLKLEMDAWMERCRW